MFGQTTLVDKNQITIPGPYFDEETGTHYNYFRDYNPTTGRYVQRDPIGLQGGINTYGYAYSNSIIYYGIHEMEVQICKQPAFDGKIRFDHYWIRTDKHPEGAGMGVDDLSDSSYRRRSGGLIVPHLGREKILIQHVQHKQI